MEPSEHPTRSSHGQTSPRQRARSEAEGWPWVGPDGRTLALAALAGGAFGFLLQKGGVAKFDILIGVLLLQNFVVLKVMLTAVLVGMVCFHLLEQRGLLERKIKPMRMGENALGGLVFGVGFGLLAYCPGTNAAAIGQGNYDAILGVVGMITGSYLYALSTRFAPSPLLGRDRGELTLPDLVGTSRSVGVWSMLLLLTLALVAIEWLEP